MSKFYVYAVWRNGETHSDEGRFTDLELAERRLAELGADENCLLAEVEVFPSEALKTDIVAQRERVDGTWFIVEGELHARTRGGEARGKLEEEADE